ncbi:hypothetical protein FUA48_04965 [Flavobacterium alkalisoli]|uniref:Pentapeptide repeat-containing protein n=1 Tax=Flavobacterium alkalisoli TaxID=2602769 RepID=A0A5B9FW44_9FLAO|nr:pentapeptide repeat-containing protein [Flavobacterium alkalisoli]QEE48952.1 hypothetical protein FUA48_04965 [Flavobacterium alkalisoli]
MTERELLENIANGKYKFNGEVFSSNISLKSIKLLKTLQFRNCEFNRKFLLRDIYSGSCSINFYNCSFHNFEIEYCDINTLELLAVKKISNLKVHDCKFQQLLLRDHNAIECYYEIFQTQINQLFICTKINNSKGVFNSSINIISEKTLQASFLSSKFGHLEIDGNYGYFDFRKNEINTSSNFFKINTNKAYFNNSNFGPISKFNSCNFESTASFKECGNISHNIFFQICTFKEQVYFTNANFNHFEITDTSFESRASFDNLETNTIRLHLVSFIKTAYFDNLKINLLTNKKNFKAWKTDTAKQWRSTLRQIKQELQKAENRIDYNRFRGYELQAYYQELDWKNNFKDKAILWATKASTGFEHSWTKALRFVLTGAAIFYTLFFISENYMLTLNLNLSSIKDFVSGYFRFLIVTDFYNPLEEKRIFIDNSNTIGWIIFILGKIVLAFGIYEMIQAFRKFKA